MHVYAAEKIPADYCGKCEEEEADSHKGVAESLAENQSEGKLSGICFGNTRSGEIFGCKRCLVKGAALGKEGGDDHQCGHCQHHEGVHKNAGHCHNALLVGILDVGESVGVRCRAHSGLVGEKAALNALTDCGFKSIAYASADESGGIKGIFEDKTEGLGNVFYANDEHDKSAKEIKHRHYGHHLFGYRADALNTADKDEECGDAEEYSNRPAGDVKGVVAGLAYGVGLNHGSHKSKGENYCNGKESGEEFSETALKGRSYIVNRAAGNGAVLVNHPCFLSKHRFTVDGGHSEKRDYPHPENCAGTADENGTAGSDDVAGTDLSGDGGGERLEGRKTAFLFSAV